MTQGYSINEAAISKWKPILETEHLPALKSRFIKAEIAKTVSYTHLDVYKRQYRDYASGKPKG